MKRRRFLEMTAAGAVAGGLAGRAAGAQNGAPVAPSDRINVGVIGPGSRGQELMRYMLRVPGVRFTALADVYEPRFAAARKIAGEETPAFTDYRRLIDASDLDVIVVATPLSLHAEHVVAAVKSGRHVYAEKSLGFTVDHCDRILAAAGDSSKQFQVGHQYRFAPWIREAVKRVRDGEIGQVTHIHGYWHRNHNWRRPVPDPKLERLINWRMYREYSGGLMAELGSHQIDIANWIFGARPESVVGSGGVDYYKDGRETNDNVQAIFRYPGGGTLVFSSITTNAKTGNLQVIYGTAGSVELTIEDAMFYYEPTRPKGPTSSEIVERGVATGATYSTKGEMPFRGTGEVVKIPEGAEGNPNYLACAAFFDAVRNGSRPLADVRAGYDSAVSVCLANKAIDDGDRIRFADHVKTRA
jgi:predicted dehydrogenase